MLLFRLFGRRTDDEIWQEEEGDDVVVLLLLIRPFVELTMLTRRPSEQTDRQMNRLDKWRLSDHDLFSARLDPIRFDSIVLGNSR